MKELVGVVKLLDQERIQDGKFIDEFKVRLRENEQETEVCSQQIQQIVKDNQYFQDEFVKGIESNFEEYKRASVEDFNSLNKKINIMAEVIDHVDEIDQEIELLKRNQRPKIKVNKKDITSPLSSVMQVMEIDKGKVSFPGSKSKERDAKYYDSGEPVNITRKYIEEVKGENSEVDYSGISDQVISKVSILAVKISN